MQTGNEIRAIEFVHDRLRLLDQRRLPREEIWLEMKTVDGVIAAIRDMVVRGAPAIGIAAAYGVALAARARHLEAGPQWPQAILPDLAALAAARPTAVNLHWALAAQSARFSACMPDPYPCLLAHARALHAADIEMNRRMGKLGSERIAAGSGVLTHCNTGALATGGYGTALGVIRTAHAGGKLAAIYATETRPWLQGARLTAWELSRERIPVTLLADSAAAALFAGGGVQWLVVGADRIAANGDTANKIGTYSLAVLARAHNVKVMVVAPTASIDLALPNGAAIPIECRSPTELSMLAGVAIAPAGVAGWNPVFDVTPAALIDVLVTELGTAEPPDETRIAQLCAAAAVG